MMEGQSSPDTASPENAFHKNGKKEEKEKNVLKMVSDLLRTGRASIGFSVKLQ